MPTTEKAKSIEQTKEWYSRAAGLIFTDYRGLQVKEFQALRKQLKAKGGEIHVVKNTLFRQAAPEVVENLPEEYHNGTTAIAFLFENESECAKVLSDFATSSKKLVIKGGFISGKTCDAKAVEKISKLPSKEVLIAQVIGAIAAPISNLIGTVESIYATPIRTIYAVVDQLGGGDATPAAEAPATETAVDATPAAEATAAEAEATETEASAGESPEASAEGETGAAAEEGADSAPESEGSAATEEPTTDSTPAADDADASSEEGESNA